MGAEVLALFQVFLVVIVKNDCANLVKLLSAS